MTINRRNLNAMAYLVKKKPKHYVLKSAKKPDCIEYTLYLRKMGFFLDQIVFTENKLYEVRLTLT